MLLNVCVLLCLLMLIHLYCGVGVVGGCVECIVLWLFYCVDVLLSVLMMYLCMLCCMKWW